MTDNSRTSYSPASSFSENEAGSSHGGSDRAADGLHGNGRDRTGEPGKSLKKEGVTLKNEAVRRLSSEADARKQTVSDQMKQVSGAVDAARKSLDDNDALQWLKSGLSKVSSSIEELAGTVENKKSGELLEEVKSFAKSRPAVFLAGCALAGFAAARVFQAGSAQMEHQQ